MIINIVGGRGLMGTIHRPIFEKAGHTVIVSGRNTNPSIEEATKNSDLTIISVPIPAVDETIKRVAPYTKAIMDLTSLKIFPIKTMIKYSNADCEVGGLHPLYGDLENLKDRTIIYCKTNKSGKRCKEIIEALRKGGLNIIESSPEEHDRLMAITQNLRTSLFEAYALVLKESGLDINKIYQFSPPPSNILLDLIARQVNSSNDEMYKSMREYNPYDKEVKELFLKVLDKEPDAANKIRLSFKDELVPAQDRAKTLIEK